MTTGNDEKSQNGSNNNWQNCLMICKLTKKDDRGNVYFIKDRHKFPVEIGRIAYTPELHKKKPWQVYMWLNGNLQPVDRYATDETAVKFFTSQEDELIELANDKWSAQNKEYKERKANEEAAGVAGSEAKPA